MSYGVLASKSGQILVEPAADTRVIGSATGTTDELLDRFLDIWGHSWVPGRLTLTKLHASFIPNRSGRGMAVLNVSLRDITTVSLTGSRLQRGLTLRTGGHQVHLRTLGTTVLAQQLTAAVEKANAASGARRPYAVPSR